MIAEIDGEGVGVGRAFTENNGLWVTDLEVLRLHYATTLLEWHRRPLVGWHDGQEYPYSCR